MVNEGVTLSVPPKDQAPALIRPSTRTCANLTSPTTKRRCQYGGDLPLQHRAGVLKKCCVSGD